jgi:8-oxo-dGTP pyrophosphatase MutT (NUDIX family)
VVGALERAGQLGEPPAASPTGDLTTSAVLIVLFEERGEARVVLTRRSRNLRSHTGQVSFPGGRIEPGEDPVAAARREATEEVALDPALVRPVGWLHPLPALVSGSWIIPVVASLPRRPELVPSPTEVARVFDVALADFLADGAFEEEHWRVPGRVVPGSADGSFPVWFFEVGTELVWGATARMLMELLSLVLGPR